MFKYTKFYLGTAPEFHESDIFRLVVPLNDAYSYDKEIHENIKSVTKNESKKTAIKNGDKKTAIKNGDKKTAITQKHLESILSSMILEQEYNVNEVAQMVGLKVSRTRELLKMLVDDGKISIIGNKKYRRYKKYSD